MWLVWIQFNVGGQCSDLVYACVYVRMFVCRYITRLNPDL
jgi:hypothetical protein